MTPLQHEWEIKLRLMSAIARSQEALAKILENVADISGMTGVPPEAETIREHVRVVTGMQGALLRMAAGHSWRPPTRGKPSAPWLSARININKDMSGGAGR